MASLAEIAAYRTSIDDLSTLAIADLAAALTALEGAPPARVRDTLIAAFPELIGPYITASGEIAATWYEDLRRQVAASPFYATASAVLNEQRANAMIRWGVKPLFEESDTTALSLIGGAVQRLIAGAGRDTVVDNAATDARSGTIAATAWSRVARPGACKFCQMLAGRGAVYRSAGSPLTVVGRGVDESIALDENGRRRAGYVGGVGGGVIARGRQQLAEKYHDFCRCLAVPTFYEISTWIDPRTGREEPALRPIAA